MAPRASSENSPWWKHVDILETFPGGARKFRCRHCGLERTGVAERVRHHLLCQAGHGIVICQQIPPAKKVEYETLALSDQRRSTSSSGAYRPASISSSIGTVGGSSGGGSSYSLDPFTATERRSIEVEPPSKRAVQGNLKSAWEPEQKARVDAAIARFFYRCAIPFNAGRTNAYKEMAASIARIGQGYVPPTYEAIREKLLQLEKAKLEKGLERIREGWENYGVSLIGDGWSDTRSRSVQGVLGYSRGRTYFVKTIDNSEGGKTAERLLEIWVEAIEQVGGPKNVIQFIGDGEASNRAAGRLLTERYPHLWFTPCMAHCLNNLLKDIGKLEWIAPLIEIGREIVTFIVRHHYILAIFRKFSSKELLKYSETRFAYNFIMLERLLEVRHSLRQLVVSDEWVNWPMHSSAIGVYCSSHCLDEAYWTDVKHQIDVVSPIITMMRLVDGEEPCVGKVYEGMDRMIENIMKVETNHERSAELKDMAVTRWEQYYVTLHAVAYVLDPEFQGKNTWNDTEVSRGWEDGLKKLVPEIEQRRVIRNQLSFYRKKEGLFGSEDAQADRFLRGSALWWEDYGADTPELQKLAIRVLSHGASSSPCERLWSSFGNIATLKRNRLGTEKANDLVFVNANLRLLEQLESRFKPEPFIGFHEEDSSVEGSS